MEDFQEDFRKLSRNLYLLGALIQRECREEPASPSLLSFCAFAMGVTHISIFSQPTIVQQCCRAGLNVLSEAIGFAVCLVPL